MDRGFFTVRANRKIVCLIETISFPSHVTMCYALTYACMVYINVNQTLIERLWLCLCDFLKSISGSEHVRKLHAT